MKRNPQNRGKKTATSPLNGAEIPLGAHPGNTGGKKGRSGRKAAPPEELIGWLKAMLDDPRHRAAFEKVLTDAGHPQFIAAVKLAAAYAYGQPTQKIEADLTHRNYVAEVPAPLSIEEWRARYRGQN